MSSRAGRVVLLILCLLVRIAPSARAADHSSVDTHVRTTEPSIMLLLRQARIESPFFRSLEARLNESDIIVYVKHDQQLASSLEGQLTFMGSAGAWRYVVVSLAWGRPEARTIATLGHELQHAIEIAEHPEIVDSETLRDAYMRIGYESSLAGLRSTYDTPAAIDAGERVFTEISHRVTRLPDRNGVDVRP
jgi:hypothetical protein